MFNRRVILLCAATAFGAASSSCTITNCEEGAICLDEDDDRASHRCVALCRHLVDCGHIDRDQRGACVDACTEGFEHEEDALEDYCECSAESTCSELSRECGRPPFTLPAPEEEQEQEEEEQEEEEPGADAGAQSDGSADGADPETDGGAAHDSGTPSIPDAAPDACSRDDDCAASEGCLDGTCHARCEASCECRSGDVCESGLCVSPPPASMSCENDCDCPAGDQCVESVCTTTATPS
jgi:hypothetical protein